MCSVSVEPGTVITLVLENVVSLKTNAPDIYEELIECAAFVNWRRVNEGQPPVLVLAFHE
jgi:hypothetical protein